ncbi:hypothetical protein [Hydrogenimonas sp. SS33]|uniref:phenylacetate--CoA ligase family protein n=1 Tax=Hydrogenimonas leucolamina TaxID=2954236 RepID=UPI00336BBF84
MSLQEKIYSRLPVFLQNIACSMKGREIASRRYSREFFDLFEKIRDRDRLPADEMSELRFRRLRDNLITAYETSEYYRDLFDRHAFDPYRMEDPDELLRLPLHRKADIKNNLHSMVNRTVEKGSTIKATTSGTTGSGLVFPMSHACERETWAVWWRYRHNHGISFDTWCAIFGARSIVPLDQQTPPFYRTISPMRQVLFSMHHLNRRNIASYVEAFNKMQIPWIHGHPSTIANMASLMHENDLRLNYPVKYITIGSENLLEHQIEIIENVFGITPIQHYGLTEPVANISMCEHGKLHIDEDYSFVELVPTEEDDNRYHLIGTSFSNDALFFLRYDTNDIVTLEEDQSCPCGRSGRIIKSIEGRKDDYIVMRDGTRIGRLSTIFRRLTHVKEAQIRQEADGHVIFFVVKSAKYTDEDETVLKEEIESRLDVDYSIKYVDTIPKTKGGKLKFVISNYEGNRK